MQCDTRQQKASKRDKERRLKYKTKAIALLGGKCGNCTSTKNLEFDHIDPSNKEFRICGGNFSWERILKELEKCQLLCAKCHTLKTVRERGQKIAMHGSASMYGNHKCRCQLCTDAWRAYMVPRIKRYRIDKRASIV